MDEKYKYYFCIRSAAIDHLGIDVYASKLYTRNKIIARKFVDVINPSYNGGLIAYIKANSEEEAKKKFKELVKKYEEGIKCSTSEFQADTQETQ